MILYERLSWLSLVLRTHGSVVSKVWPRFFTTTAVSVVVTYLQRYDAFHFSLTLAPFLIVGLPLGIILGFRNTSSYERFWDGRKLWGQLVNTSRTFTRQLDAFVVAKNADETQTQTQTQTEELASFKRAMTYRCIAFSRALCNHLRRKRDFDSLKELLSADEIKKLHEEASPPAAIVHRLGQDLKDAQARGWLDARHSMLLDAALTSFTDVLGGCERIKNTPTPISYLIFIHRSVALYCLILPFGVADTVHNFTPVVVFFVSYALFSMDAIGDELDNPFRKSANTLPIAAIARNIEIELRRRLGETTLPDPLTPTNGILY